MSFLFTPSLLRGKETLPVAEALAGKEVVLLYMSAHWCPPCKAYTPQLKEWYNKQGGKAEIIFVSSDSDEAAFESYYASMPWLAIPYSERLVVSALMSTCGVIGIPAVVAVRVSDGVIVSKSGRQGVLSAPEGFPWADGTEKSALVASGDSSKVKLVSPQMALPAFLTFVTLLYFVMGPEWRNTILMVGGLGFALIRGLT